MTGASSCQHSNTTRSCHCDVLANRQRLRVEIFAALAGMAPFKIEVRSKNSLCETRSLGRFRQSPLNSPKVTTIIIPFNDALGILVSCNELHLHRT